MNPQLQKLADRIGVKLSDRVAMDVDHGVPECFQWNQALYDGKTIATKVQRWKYIEYDNDGLDYEEILGDIEDRFDHDILHEMAHWFAASEVQRELPEFGLGTVAYGEGLGDDFGEIKTNPIPGVVEHAECETQEYMAWFLCVKWGKELGISPALENFKVKDWDEYLTIKIGHGLHNIPGMWEALTRLNKQGIIP